MRGLDSLERLSRPRAHFIGDVEIGPQGRSGKETRNHGIEAGRGGSALAWKLGAHWPGADYAEVASPAVLGRVDPSTRVDVDWDGTPRPIALATTEFFMPILVTMEVTDLDAFIAFSLEDNPHDLATSLWTRDDAKLWRARRTLGGMLKENDGTDSALEWEEFGASGVGESGNTGVGDAAATIGMFCRRQKGRHFVLPSPPGRN